MKTYETKTDRCPSCGKDINRASAAEKDCERGPGPGDISLCIECAAILVFTDKLELKEAGLNDLIKMTEEQRRLIGKAQAFIRERR